MQNGYRIEKESKTKELYNSFLFLVQKVVIFVIFFTFIRFFGSGNLFETLSNGNTYLSESVVGEWCITD